MKTPLKLKKTRKTDTSTVATKPWRVLVVDDDRAVHAVTEMILSKINFQNRGIEILHAYSGGEAAELMSQETDIALLLLDVVMETDDAGLQLVKTVREGLGNKATRIVLRTGQPGQAPQEAVVVEFDINDYKAKSELTSEKLFATVITALRSYETIITIEKNRAGLEKILDSTSALYQINSVHEFAEGVLTQLASFLNCKPHGLICAQIIEPDSLLSATDGEDLAVLACAGDLGVQGTDHSLPPELETLIRRSLQEERSIIDQGCTTLYLNARSSRATAVLLTGNRDAIIDDADRNLLDVFASKISLAMSNALTYQKMISAETAATIDFLTGLNNRRQLIRLTEPLFANAARGQQAVAVAIIDVDHFKHINDTWGHDAGDQVLAGLGELIRARFRKMDVSARYGGEEFCIVAPNVDEGAAFKLFDDFRQKVEDFQFYYGKERMPVTVSCGLSLGVAEEFDVLLKRADESLYLAKERGRNQVVCRG